MSSPPPSYSPPRPPPPYEEENERNAMKEPVESTFKISPPQFVPLSPAQIDVTQLNGQQQQTIRSHTHIVVVHGIKAAPTFSPYQEFCPKCNKEVMTKQAYVTGSLTWIVFILVLFFFFPLAFIPFCLDSCKDAQHYCPKCATLLSIKKRFI